VRTDTLPVEDAEPLKLELEDFLRSVRERGRPRVPGEAGRDALELADRVLEAIEEHRRTLDGVVA
jgi:predicted dehydrogenase